MYQQDAAATYEAAKADMLALKEKKAQEDAAAQELRNREASCPRCKARNPDPCIERTPDGWREMSRCHSQRASRWLQGW
jgi:hypothetical protein